MDHNKILVIDDEETIIRVLSISLKADGYKVSTALSGEEGIETYKKNVPDIVLTDIKMPGMDGIEVLKEIKTITPDTEVIIVTGHGDIENAIEALKFGASDFLTKPILDEALTIALNRAREKLQIRQKLKNYTETLEKEVALATKTLRQRSNFMAKLIHSSNNGIIATDEKHKIEIYNPAAERIFGYPKEEVVERLSSLNLYPKEVHDYLKENESAEDISTEIPWKDLVIKTMDGSEVPVRFSGALLREKAKTVGNVAFFQDMREIKRLEQELLHSERLAAVGQTVAGLAHCIKNILQGFNSGSYLVDLGLTKSKHTKLEQGWDMIKRNISRTSDLAMDLLSYSKKREPVLEPVNPNDIAGEVCDVVQEVAIKNDIEIIRDFDQSLGEVKMDSKAIYRALLNLMTNAVDACLFDTNTDKLFRVRLKTAMREDSVISFEISDNGVGMTDDITEKLFTSFFSTKGHRGTGLGLMVTHKLVEEQKGTIFVESSPGKGTTFTIDISLL